MKKLDSKLMNVIIKSLKDDGVNFDVDYSNGTIVPAVEDNWDGNLSRSNEVAIEKLRCQYQLEKAQIYSLIWTSPDYYGIREEGLQIPFL